MRKLLIILIAMAVMALAGCGVNTEEATTQATSIAGNIYTYGMDVPGGISEENMGELHGQASFVFAKFNADGVIEWVDMVQVDWTEYEFNKYYGVYEVDGRKLTITLSGEAPVLCIIQEDTGEITLGAGNFKLFDETKFTESDEILAQFDEG